MHTNKPDSAADPMGLKPAGTAQAQQHVVWKDRKRPLANSASTEAGFTAVLLRQGRADDLTRSPTTRRPSLHLLHFPFHSAG